MPSCLLLSSFNFFHLSTYFINLRYAFFLQVISSETNPETVERNDFPIVYILETLTVHLP